MSDYNEITITSVRLYSILRVSYSTIRCSIDWSSSRGSKINSFMKFTAAFAISGCYGVLTGFNRITEYTAAGPIAVVPQNWDT